MLNDIMDLGDNHSAFYQLNELLGVEIIHSAGLFKRSPSTQAHLYNSQLGRKGSSGLEPERKFEGK